MAKGLSDPYAGHAEPHPIPWPCMQLSNRAVSHPNGSIRYLREAVFAKPIRIGLPYFKETVGVIVKDTLLAEEIASYWNGRAESYSNGVNGELSDGRKDAWSTELQHILAGQIELAKAENRPARILDLGCGPGFFSIILSRMGCAVDAVDGSIEMLARAQENAKRAQADDSITFCESDVVTLPFDDCTFDAAVSRNLTWLMRDPEGAYCEWLRVLKPNGVLAVFDANWYLYLFDLEIAEKRKSDMANNALEGWDEDAQATSDEEKRSEEIARSLPLSPVVRPAWDLEVLDRLGAADVVADENVWQRVWTENEHSYYASSPQFLVKAVK